MKKKNIINLILVIVFIILICSMSGAYAFFYYYQEDPNLNVVTMGDLNFGFSLLHSPESYYVQPISDDEARFGSFTGGKTDIRYGDDFHPVVNFSKYNSIYSMNATNSYTDQDLEYKIILEHNDDIDGHTRMNDWDIVFDLVEISPEGEKYLIKGESYTDFDGLCIHTGYIKENDGEVQRLYVIRAWVNENTIISDTNPFASYDGDENLFYGYKVKVIAQTRDPIKEACSIEWNRSDTKGTVYTNYMECNSYNDLTNLLTSNSSIINNKTFIHDLKINYNLNDTNINFNILNSITALTNLDISNFNTSNVTKIKMSNLYNLENIVGLNTINTDSLTDISEVFNTTQDYYRLNLMSIKIDNWNLDNVTSMNNAFGGSYADNINLPKYVKNYNVDMGSMFQYSKVKYLDFSRWDVRPTNIENLFSSAQYLNEIHMGGIDTRNCTNFDYSFSTTRASIIDVAGLNTNNVTSMVGTFAYNTSVKSYDLSSFNFSRVSSCGVMFASNSDLETIYSSSDASMGACGTNSFSYRSSKIVGGNGTSASSLDSGSSTYLRVDSPSNPGLFTVKENKYCNIYYSNSNTRSYSNMLECSGINDMKSKIDTLTGAKSMKIVYKGDSNTEPSYIYNLFSGVENSLEYLDVSQFDGSTLYSIASLFAYLSKLEEINLDGLDISSATMLNNLFMNCTKLKFIDLSGIKFNKHIVSMENVFSGCTSLEKIIGFINLSDCTDYYATFKNCNSLTYVDLTGYTGAGTNYQSMFKECCSLLELNLTNFDFNDVEDISHMFECDTTSSNLYFIYVNDDIPDLSWQDTIFWGCIKLEGYSNSNVWGSMFNYENGYLTLLI